VLTQPGTKKAEPMKPNRHLPIAILFVMLGVAGCTGQSNDRAEFQPGDSPTGAADPFAGLDQASVLLLGTFHFDDPGLDSYQPETSWDPNSVEHQKQIDEVVQLFGRFRPTRIAVEWKSTHQEELDATYHAWLDGEAQLGASEVQQLGFRLARRFAHPTIYAVDVAGRSCLPDMTEEEYERQVSEAMAEADPALVQRQLNLEARYNAAYQFYDSLKVAVPLREYLLRTNDPEVVASWHGHYLIGTFYLGVGADYLGPDMRTEWYNRNLRILRNLQRISSKPGERILLIIGSGHLPILRHAVIASPEYKLVEVREYLGR